MILAVIAEKQAASLLTLDVSGAFDIVQRNRMDLRLRQQGWPTEMVRWVESFLTDRTVAVRASDGQMTNTIDLECGSPQGSPISPILFMSYISPLLSLNKE